MSEEENNSSIVFPYTAEVDTTALEILERYPDLEPATHTEDNVNIAGRLMLRRVQGKLCFGTLVDHSGKIQLFSTANSTQDFDEFTSLNLGDWISVSGKVMTTKRGELSVNVESWKLLAKTKRSFPDKWHGISDTDMRYRQRYLDLWVTESARTTFAQRSKVLSSLRKFMEARNYMEVETPVFHPIPGGALARPFTTHHNALDVELFLRIAPELYLKRLIVGGFPKVFEIARVFRNEGLSPRHNPEFTMMECYEAYGDYQTHMDLTEKLVESLALEVCGTTEIEYDGRPLSLKAPWRRATLSSLVSEAIGDEVDVRTPVEVLAKYCDKYNVEVKDTYGSGKLLLELYEKLCESKLWEPVFVTDYPKEVSPLARNHRDDPLLTERFEGIIAGRELCNGFSELCDSSEQRARFEDQAMQKEAGDDEAMIVDEDYLRALDYGLPPTVGLGIGIDRLVMLLTQTTTIRDVVFFPTLKPEQSRSDQAAGSLTESS